jgi:hypothetical protein
MTNAQAALIAAATSHVENATLEGILEDAAEYKRWLDDQDKIMKPPPTNRPWDVK